MGAVFAAGAKPERPEGLGIVAHRQLVEAAVARRRRGSAEDAESRLTIFFPAPGVNTTAPENIVVQRA